MNSKILKDLIKLSGLNQKKFAEKHGMTSSRVSERLKGTRNIKLTTLTEIAKKEGYDLQINYELVKTQ